ncbi:nitroreductase family protein [Oceaniglobus roseus]|uniref:nitroreductase family protein n=1 Tax=Oceaniglobus roseus TaxID=1737570 RepID=UPI001300090A|nr:nitroreductase family protein [Kandeliimicrobium roseum]
MPHMIPRSPSGRLSRRSLMIGTALGVAAIPDLSAASETGELTVTEALRRRRSTRSFSDRPVDPALLAELLWAAFGINRPAVGLHTAPSWHGAAETVIHVASADGVARYDPANDSMTLRHAADIRGILSPQPFVATAPLCLVHIADLRRLTAAEDPAERLHHARVDAAIVAQNVYLFAAARGLGTCLVGGFDEPAIAAALDLPDHERTTFVQPVGWPAA